MAFILFANQNYSRKYKLTQVPEVEFNIKPCIQFLCVNATQFFPFFREYILICSAFFFFVVVWQTAKICSFVTFFTYFCAVHIFLKTAKRKQKMKRPREEKNRRKTNCSHWSYNNSAITGKSNWQWYCQPKKLSHQFKEICWMFVFFLLLLPSFPVASAYFTYICLKKFCSLSSNEQYNAIFFFLCMKISEQISNMERKKLATVEHSNECIFLYLTQFDPLVFSWAIRL